MVDGDPPPPPPEKYNMKQCGKVSKLSKDHRLLFNFDCVDSLVAIRPNLLVEIELEPRRGREPTFSTSRNGGAGGGHLI